MSLHRPLVMGIVNITPDSFSDGGRYLAKDQAIAHAEKLISEGADILDFGAESTRPGAQPVSAAEELQRLLPVLKALKNSPVPLSVDTRKAEVMRQVIDAGVSMINDIEALADPASLAAVVNSKVAVCLMHMQGTPQSMQLSPTYRDVVDEVQQFLHDAADRATVAGIARTRVIVDPGFGFGKTLEHNLEIMRQLERLTSIAPVMVGLSRKSMLGKVIGRDKSHDNDRLPASIAAAVLAVQRGAAIVRVHDVAATVDAIKIYQAVIGKAL